MSISKQFILAGDAIFTIDVPPGASFRGDITPDHITYRIQHVDASAKYPAAWFVKVMVGSDNESDRSYAYLGRLDDFTGQVRTTAKSCRRGDSFAVVALNRVLARIWGDDLDAVEAAGWKVHHEGKCGRCGCKLTVPESVTDGIGPECRQIMGLPPIRPTRAQRREIAIEADARRMESSPASRAIREQPTFQQPTDAEQAAIRTWVADMAAKMNYRGGNATLVQEVDCFDLSDRPEVDVRGMQARTDDEGEIIYWLGQVDRRPVQIFND